MKIRYFTKLVSQNYLKTSSNIEIENPSNFIFVGFLYVIGTLRVAINPESVACGFTSGRLALNLLLVVSQVDD